MDLQVMKTAKLHRMDMEGHTCPFGLKAKDLLEREGFKVEDHRFTSREAVDAFKAQHNVKTTPQIWIDGKHIGGHDALRAHLGKSVKNKDETSYQPVIAIFSVAFLMSIALVYATLGSFPPVKIFEWFIAILWKNLSLCGSFKRHTHAIRRSCLDSVPNYAFYRYARRLLRFQGGLCRKARVKMRMRWGR